MHPASERALCKAAIRTSHHSFTADYTGVTHQAVGDELRMFHHVSRVADDAGDQDAILRNLDVAPYFPFVLMTNIGSFKLIAAHAQLQKQIDDFAQRNVEHMRGVPTAPTNVISNSLLRQAIEGMIECVNAK